ncbi:MAG: carbohydrate kinase family protein [DPANN group archaeon]|nr:carbohydrate kinase family protein [DPANN group archaeon]
MIISIGNPSMDNVSLLGDRKLQAGGASIYSALAASVLSKVAIVGKIGHDYPQNFLVLLEKKGLDISHLKTIKCPSKSFDMIIDENLEATYPKYEVSIDSKLNFKDIPKSYFKSQNSFIITQMSPRKQLNFIENIKKNSPKSLILVNTHYPFIEKSKGYFPKLIDSCDIFVMNEREAQLLTGVPRTDVATHMLSRQYKNTLIIVTLGVLGSFIIKNTQIQFAPSIYNANVKDPTGSGDSFSGAFLASYTSVMDPVRSAIVGNAIASLNSEKRGFEALVNLKFKNINSLWDFMLLRSKNMNNTQKVIFDFV